MFRPEILGVVLFCLPVAIWTVLFRHRVKAEHRGRVEMLRVSYARSRAMIARVNGLPF